MYASLVDPMAVLPGLVRISNEVEIAGNLNSARF